MKKVSTLSLSVILLPFFIGLVYGSGNRLMAAVTADFESNVNLIATGNSVNFLDLTTGDPVSWNWTFVGGTPSSYSGQVPPAITYNSSGQYTVILEVEDAGGNVSVETKNAYIDVDDYPTGWDVSQTGSSHLISIPLAVTVVGDPLSYGDFIGVFFLDENSEEKCGGFSIWDGANNQVVTAFGDDMTTDPVKEGFADGEDFLWKVYYASTPEQKDATVSYNQALPNNDGTYADNGLSSLTQIITGLLEVSASADPASGCEGDVIQLNAGASGGSGTYTYSWTSVPAGFTSSQPNPTASPAVSTVYTVEVDDGISIVSDDVNVTISPAPTADAGSDQSICMPDVVVLAGTAQNYSSIQWQTSGTGTFDNGSNLSTNYNPSQADVDGGSVVLTLVAGPVDPCQVAAQDDISASFVVPPTADVGLDQTICEGETVQFSADVSNYCGISWSSDGDGTFDNATGASTTYYPGTTDIASGTVEICIQADACDPCTVDDSDCMTLTIQKLPTVLVGADVTICEGETVPLSGTVENHCGFGWTTNGDGTFSDPSGLEPVYTPGESDIAAGTVSVCLQADACVPCTGSASDCLEITIQKAPIIDVGSDITLCETDDVMLNASGENYCNLLWTTNGNGTFSNTASLSVQYFPGTEDIGSTVELCLTAGACNPCLVDAFDCLNVTIVKNPTADAGPDVTICEGEDVVPLTTIENECGIQWTSTGDGSFNDETVENPVYTPGDEDIAAGQVEICVNVAPCNPCLLIPSDCMLINIQEAPTVFAGNDAEICEGENLILNASATAQCGLTWTTGGDGTFDDAASLGATYYPGTDDISEGTVEICLTAAACTPCTVDAFDCYDLTIQKQVTASAGPDATICEGAPYLLSGASAANFSQVQWSSVDGTGTFNNGTIVMPTYTPSIADYALGCVNLQIDAQPISPCSVAASDMMELCFQAPPEVDAGGDATICEGDDYQLSGAASSHYQTLQWLSSGDGTFDDASLENPVYTHGTNDLSMGSVTLTAIASPIDPCIGSVQDEMVLSIQPKPEANAGDDATVADEETYTNTDAFVANYSDFYWESAGDGSFDDAGILNTTYTPGTQDQTDGSVELCLTAEPISPCLVADVDCLTLVIGLAPNVYAGPDATVCEGSSLTLDEATGDNYLSILWNTSGDGTFNDATLINPEYTPGLNDISSGTVELCITAQPIPPSTVVGNNCMLLTIQTEPAITIGDDQTICEGEDYLFNETVASNYESLLWSSVDGTGSFSDPGALKPTYFPSETDYALGCVTIQAAANPVDPCTTVATDDMTLCFQLLPSAIAGEDATICEGDSYDLSGQVTEACGQYWETNGDGSFDDFQNLFATYTPGSGDIANGFVEVCLYADPCSPCSTQGTDCLTIFIQPEPTVDAGADQEICEDDTFQTEPVVENTCGVLWTSTGDGEFDNPGEMLAIYTPGANDIANGSVTLCIDGFPCNPCDISYGDCMTLTIVKNPTVFAGADETICEGEVLTINDATVENQSAIQWFTSDGSGSFNNATIINPVYTPSPDDYQLECITLGVQAQPTNPCSTVAEDYRSLCFQLNPVVDAGLDVTICETESYTMATDVQNACGYQWTTAGDGTFDDAEIADATYFPGLADIDNGGAELCLALDACDPCGGTVSDCIILTIQKEPEAYAGEDTAIAEGQTYTLSQATASNFSALAWTTNGDGGFDDPASQNPVYSPGSGDENNGMVTLCLAALPVDPCQTEAVDCMDLEIGPFPVVNAGMDQIICENQTLNLSGASAQNYLTLLWTISGEGTFDDPTDENPTYFPSASDINNGSVELCIAAEAIPPATGAVNDCMNLTIQLNPFVDAGTDATICEGETFTTSGASGSDYGALQWSTTSGTGQFLNPGDLEATYVPSFLDFISGCVTLQVTVAAIDPCTTGSADNMQLCFQEPPVANAGEDAVICETGSVTLNGSVSEACGFQWSTSGDGSFSDPQDLNAVYVPGQIDIMLGFAEICLTADACAPCSTSDEDCLILTIQPAPVANAGANAQICENDTYQLNGSAENACGILWETQGDGEFDDATLTNAIYTPGVQDISNGFVQLCLTANPCDPCNAQNTDCMLLDIQPLPEANAGDDRTICENQTLELSGTSADNHSGLQWTTSGNGAFDNAQILNPEYTPTPDDIAEGCITLTLEALPINPCSVSAFDDMELCFQPLPEINAGVDATICEGENFTANPVSENTCGYSWITNGDGTFVDSQVLNATYIPGTNDLEIGSVEICVTADACLPCAEGLQDCLIITIQKEPTAYAGPDDGVIAGNDYEFQDAEAGNYAALLWESNGDGSFDDPTALNPTYTHGPGDEANFGVELCLTAQPIDPCQASVQDCMILQIGSMPEITAGPDVTLCAEDQYLIVDASAFNFSSLEWTTQGDGTFDDNSIVNPVYFMGTQDLANGSVELCMQAEPVPPATISATDCMVLSVVYEPTANAGENVTLCGDEPYLLQGSAENYCDLIWSTSGDGEFNDAGLLQPLYTPGNQDMANGSVQLCFEAAPCSPCTIATTACITMTLLEAPEANAGNDVTICENKSTSLSGSVSNNCDFYWETTGDGTFDDISSLTPTYTPGEIDELNGFAEVCLVALPCQPCTTTVTDCMIVNIQLLPQPDPGPDASVCIGDNYDLDGSLEYGNGFFWQTNGTGTFGNSGSLETTYYPSQSDYSNGSVSLIIFAFPVNPCTNFQTESMTLSFVSDPTVDAGEDVTVCSTEPYTLQPDIQDACGVVWETSGDGEFDDNMLINATYIPGPNDVVTGSVELCVTGLPCGSCETPDSDCMIITFIPGPVANAGNDATICENQVYQLGGSSENDCGTEWTTSGDGTFDNSNALNAVYTPGTNDLNNGSAVITLSAQACAPCENTVSDDMTLEFAPLPIADAGPEASILAGEDYQVLEAIVSNASTFSWSTNGDGEFDDATNISPIYTPGNGDIAGGSATLCLTAQAIDPCVSAVTDCKELFISSPPMANAGPDLTICENGTITLENASAENYSNLIWTTTGDGTFGNSGIENPVYFPGTADIQNGEVQLCLEAQPIPPATQSDEDCMTLFFQPAPVANAGDDITICEDQQVQLAGFTEHDCGSFWTTDGDGLFDDSSLLGAVFTPGSQDIADGTVTVCLTAEPCEPCDLEDQDCLTITIVKNPVAIAGEDDVVCEGDSYTLSGSVENACGLTWTSLGTGTFDDTGLADATYYPSPDDISNGSVELCLQADPCAPCTASESDCMVLTFAQPPTGFAGDDVTICEGQSVSPDAFASNACGFLWTTNGDGSFNDNSIIEATYIPGPQDIADGTVEICLEVFACDPCNGSISSCLNITILKQAQSFAGENDVVCEGSEYQLNGDVSDACDWQWTTNGDGGFDDAGSLTAVYTPGTGDIAAGSVEICLEAFPCDPCTGSDQDCITLTFQPEATAEAGEDATVCEVQDVQLAGLAGNACDFYWTSDGDGQFDNALLENAVYTPGSGDVTTGQVALCFTAVSCNPCETEISDCLTLTIVSNPVADAGQDQTICEDQTVTLSGQATQPCGMSWTTSGFGSFDDNQSLSAVYTPAGFDFGLGEVELCLTIQPCNPCTLPDVDCMTVTILEVPEVFAGEDDAACVDAPYQLDGHAENVSGVLWSTSGDGTFDNPEIPDAQYVPGAGDVTAGIADLTLTGYPVDPCTLVATDVITITLHNCQTTVIPAGWSGISTWIDPLDADLEEIFDPIIGELIILQDMQNSWWPAENINTIGTWDYQKGYKIKVDEEVTLNIPGNLPADKNLTLDAGWNLIPVLSSCPVDVEALFAGTSLIIVKEVAGWHLYWPQFNINSLENAQPGKAYLVKMETSETITFPDCDDLKAYPQNTTGSLTPPAIWTDVKPTAISHVVAIPDGAVGFDEFDTGDFIGVVDDAGNCFGFAKWTGNTSSITIYGNDPLTLEKEGFEPGEPMTLVHLENQSQVITELMVVYDDNFHADGQFIENGISVLKSLNATGISSPDAQQEIIIYPNPVKQTLNIKLGRIVTANLEVLNMQGQLIWSGEINDSETKLDVSTFNSGVYLIRISGDGFTHVERITKQ